MKEIQIKMLEDWEEINLKISRQFKLLELDEKETEGLITINKRSEIEKHLQHVQLKLEKLQEFESDDQVEGNFW